MPENELKNNQTDPDKPGSDKSGNSEPIRLLLVDDEKGFANVISKRLRKRNIDVATTYSGSEAIKVLRKKKFDVAVLDLKMEDMNGIEVLKIFKTMAPDLSVVMLTGHGSEQAARDGIALGAVDYLTKPCDFGELVDKIREAFKIRKEKIVNEKGLNKEK
ncbi:MAG: response regulator [Deltaproteobacteria bacterium]|nr:response regulator [Deltaproteobacteria bacterium]